MMTKGIVIAFFVMLCLSPLLSAGLGATHGAAETTEQEYEKDSARIEARRRSLLPGKVNNLEKYEEFADEIRNKWKDGDRERYARLMLQVCGPLSSGNFENDRRYELARKFALSALEKPDTIPLPLELELIGHAITLMGPTKTLKDEDFSRNRKEDVRIRLHAWKRLLDAIDPKWDPNEELLSRNAVAVSFGFPGAVTPESINDPDLRARYEAAMEANRQKIQEYGEQDRLRKWLKKFPKSAEAYIIQAYSTPPYNLDELKHYLEEYIADEDTGARILDAVGQNTPKE